MGLSLATSPLTICSAGTQNKSNEAVALSILLSPNNSQKKILFMYFIPNPLVHLFVCVAVWSVWVVNAMSQFYLLALPRYFSCYLPSVCRWCVSPISFIKQMDHSYFDNFMRGWRACVSLFPRSLVAGSISVFISITLMVIRCQLFHQSHNPSSFGSVFLYFLCRQRAWCGYVQMNKFRNIEKKTVCWLLICGAFQSHEIQIMQSIPCLLFLDVCQRMSSVFHLYLCQTWGEVSDQTWYTWNYWKIHASRSKPHCFHLHEVARYWFANTPRDLEQRRTTPKWCFLSFLFQDSPWQ